MANEFTAFGSALFSRIGTATGMTAHYGIAPQGGTPPYIIYQRLSGVDDYTFGKTSNDRGLSVEYEVKVISNREWPGEAQTRAGSIDALMHDAPLNVSGFTTWHCRRKRTIEFRDTAGFWNVGGIYRIEVWGT